MCIVCSFCIYLFYFRSTACPMLVWQTPPPCDLSLLDILFSGKSEFEDKVLNAETIVLGLNSNIIKTLHCWVKPESFYSSPLHSCIIQNLYHISFCANTAAWAEKRRITQWWCYIWRLPCRFVGTTWEDFATEVLRLPLIFAAKNTLPCDNVSFHCNRQIT